ncbi:AsnC family transcriptional regulator [Nocardiopsis gilva YIM 90087]|uniref:AsnC family transcriptional regulator n=3 Tax=Nocardiopsis gilva TaxID=280236 RepID=A0A223SD67_9ACTN|nr:AsnC family transcriptional regulator [Nocardiopsis gilva]ASU86088.1 AsnC family transcriptional regulator [Nocardiopsis gilva YIM 90087]
MRHRLDDTDRRIVAALLASPRASWRTVSDTIGVSERTVVRRAGPLLQDGTVRVTAVRNPGCFPELIPMALRIRCRPRRIRAVAAVLAERPDTVWVDVLSGGDEISTVVFLDGPEARNRLLLRDLPATEAVDSWTSHTLLRVFPAAFDWTGGLLSPAEAEVLRREVASPPGGLALDDTDHALIRGLADNGRATYTELARRARTAALTARRRTDLLADRVVRLATEVDLALLGIHAEALLWMTVAPGGLDATAHALSRHPQIHFTAATTGPANLMAAAAAADLDALYSLLTDTIGGLRHVTGIETTPILATFKRAGLPRPNADRAAH